MLVEQLRNNKHQQLQRNQKSDVMMIMLPHNVLGLVMMMILKMLFNNHTILKIADLSVVIVKFFFDIHFV